MELIPSLYRGALPFLPFKVLNVLNIVVRLDDRVIGLLSNSVKWNDKYVNKNSL